MVLPCSAVGCYTCNAKKGDSTEAEKILHNTRATVEVLGQGAPSLVDVVKPPGQ